MKRALITGVIALFAWALIAPAAESATRFRKVQVEISSQAQVPSGILTLEFLFKNKPATRHKFTPRQLTLIDFSHVPLTCMNAPGEGASQLLLTETLDVRVKLTKAPQPSGKRPKPGRYAFRFAYSFTGFAGMLTGTIDKPNHGDKRGVPRSQGSLTIGDLDSNPGHTNCSTDGPKSWGGLPLTGV